MIQIVVLKKQTDSPCTKSKGSDTNQGGQAGQTIPVLHVYVVSSNGDYEETRKSSIAAALSAALAPENKK